VGEDPGLRSKRWSRMGGEHPGYDRTVVLVRSEKRNQVDTIEQLGRRKDFESVGPGPTSARPIRAGTNPNWISRIAEVLGVSRPLVSVPNDPDFPAAEGRLRTIRFSINRDHEYFAWDDNGFNYSDSAPPAITFSNDFEKIKEPSWKAYAVPRAQ